MRCVKLAFAVWIVLPSISAFAEESAREALNKAMDYVAAARAIHRVDTTEATAVVVVAGNRIEQKLPVNVVTIDIDRPKQLARQAATVQGQELVILKQGDKAAMKLG